MCERGAERPELQLAELKGLRLWQGCGRGDTWLMIHQGALEAQGNSSRERHLCARGMLGAGGACRQQAGVSEGRDRRHATLPACSLLLLSV